MAVPVRTATHFINGGGAMLRRVWIVLVALVLGAVVAGSPGFLIASDHDDGETDTKGRNVNLTDLYAFREKDQNTAASPNDLILTMNTNPRSVAQQQYFFSISARYEFKIERVFDNNASPTAAGLSTPDVVLRFEFDEPDPVTKKQPITLTVLRDGVITNTVSAGFTTPLNTVPTVNEVSLGGKRLDVFAGLREDPFFFDVEQFFRVRAAALLGSSVGFRPACTAAPVYGCAVDFTAGYNVNAIVMRVPIVFLQASAPAKTFDIWATISVCPPGTSPDASCPQVERLAQPAINEGLIRTNAFLNALNSVTPAFEALALTPGTPEAAAAAPILAEAVDTLAAFGNSSEQIAAIVGAFLPDVMRIDTSGPSGYAAAVNTAGRPVRGRKITDDVIDITLSVLVPGPTPVPDNVSYVGPNANGSGHKPLLPKFPYLAAPN